PPRPLTAGMAAARAAGGLSRLARRGGGATGPGKVLGFLSPDAVEQLARRLPLGTALVSATNGKTTTTAMVAEIIGARTRLAHNASGANLVSGVASTLLSSRGAELGLFEVDEAALPEVARRVRPRALALGNLFRDQLDRYGELELVAERWRRAVEALGAETTLVVNGDDPQVGDLARGRAASAVCGMDAPNQTPPRAAGPPPRRPPSWPARSRSRGSTRSGSSSSTPREPSRSGSPCLASTTSTTRSPRRLSGGCWAPRTRRSRMGSSASRPPSAGSSVSTLATGDC